MTLTASTSTLPAGSWTAIIEVAAADASIVPATLTVTANVNAPVRAPGIVASPAAVTVSAVEGGADPAPEVIAITNGGGGTLDGLALAIRYDAGQPTGWLNAVLGGPAAPTNITAQATTGTLVAGTYGATIEVSSPVAGNSPLAIDVAFTVLSPPSIVVSATSVAFSDVVGGSGPPSQAIDVTNGGGGTLDGLSLAVTYGSGKTPWLGATLSGSTAPASIDLQPVTGSLAAGTYTATVEVTSATAANSPVSIDVTFTVAAAPVPPAIALSTGSLVFGAAVGGVDPAAQSVDVTNGGGGTLDGLGISVAYAAGQPTGWLSASIASATAPTTIIVQPATGQLAPGTYDATITVASAVASNSPATIDVTFTVATPPTAPTLLSATEHHHHAELKWQDNSSDETSFIVQRSLQASGGGWTDVVTLQANTTSYRDDAVTRGLLYYYRIAACNAAGCSISNVLSVAI
jgi:hypothetical protein